METYTFLRQLADSWALLAMFVFFIGIVIWAFRPGSKKVHEDTANIPFRHEDRPAPEDGENRSASRRNSDRSASRRDHDRSVPRRGDKPAES